MKRFQSSILIFLCLLSAYAVATSDVASTPETSAAPSSNQKLGGDLASVRTSVAALPKNFMSYASKPTDIGKTCIVGVVTNDDGVDQKPVVYAEAAKSKRIVWLDHLALPAQSFQSRATHCTNSSDSFFVLLQADTQREQTLSQTLLQVVKIRADTGEVLARQDVVVPDAFTTWVDEGSANFRLKDGMLRISGNFRAHSNEGAPISFNLRLDEKLHPVKDGKS